MKKYGLLGRTLSHSFSRRYFNEKFTRENTIADYTNFEIENISQVRELLDSDLSGFNVTIPYKQQIIPYLDKLDTVAQKVGSVNTLKKINRYWVGYNTDVIGFKESLLELDLPFDLKDSRSLIFGTGGASLAILYVLEKFQSKCTIVSRSKGDHNYSQLKDVSLSNYDLIINTTPIGMYPNIDETLDINMDQFRKGQLVYDLIYNPQKTLLLGHAEERGATIMNGERMLELQAEASWDIWNQNDK